MINKNIFKDISFQLILILLLKALVMAGIILYAGIGLSPDEAQYWTWSQALDWGYYSKPPAIAWQIWAGTRLFGQTELGVRFIALFISFFQSYAVYYLALATGLQKRTAFWCGLMMAFCPIGVFGSFFAITDGGFLLFWTLASICMANSLLGHKEPDPLIIGLCIFAGALFKWPIYFFWIFYFCFRQFYFRDRKTTRIFLGLAVSLMGLLPSIWWNWSHDWATFKHVASTVQGGHGSGGGNPLEFLGGQMLLLSPVLFVLLVKTVFSEIKSYRQMSLPLVFCGTVFLFCFLVMFIASFFQKIQGNWALFAYPTAIVLLGWHCCEAYPRKFVWVKIGIGLSMLLVCLVISWPSFSTYYRINPFKHNLGWHELRALLSAQGYDPKQNFLVSDRYQLTSILSFYSDGQKRAYFLNLERHRKNQFSYWPGINENEQNKTGYFVWVENSPHLQNKREEKKHFYQTELKKYFEKVNFLGLHSLIKIDQDIVKGVLLFQCESCLNVKPDEAEIY